MRRHRRGDRVHAGRAVQPHHAPGLERRGRPAPGRDADRRVPGDVPGGHALGRARSRARWRSSTSSSPPSAASTAAWSATSDFAGDADLAIAIRTATIVGGVARVQAGAGLVADSDPRAEYAGVAEQGGRAAAGRRGRERHAARLRVTPGRLRLLVVAGAIVAERRRWCSLAWSQTWFDCCGSRAPSAPVGGDRRRAARCCRSRSASLALVARARHRRAASFRVDRSGVLDALLGVCVVVVVARASLADPGRARRCRCISAATGVTDVGAARRRARHRAHAVAGRRRSSPACSMIARRPRRRASPRRAVADRRVAEYRADAPGDVSTATRSHDWDALTRGRRPDGDPR